MIESLSNRWQVVFLTGCLGFCCGLLQSQGQGTLNITFDGDPPQPRGTAFSVKQYYESGMGFRPIDPDASFTRHGGGNSASPENGTAYLRAAFTQSLTFNFTDGSLFGVAAVDLAEYSTVVPDPVTVHFVGYRYDGSIVTTDFTTDGIIDGTGLLADFQTFYFGPEFSGLSRVEVPVYGWSLDNLQVSYGVPEPPTGVLLLLGGLLLWAVPRWRRKPGR